MHIHMVTALLQSTNYPYNLHPYQIYSYAMSCRYNSTPAFLSQIQLTTEESLFHLLFKMLQQCCDVKYCSKHLPSKEHARNDCTFLRTTHEN